MSLVGEEIEIIKKKKTTKKESKEIQEAINAIKTNAVESGKLPSSSKILIQDFTGMKLKISKSIVKNSAQHFVNKGTEWKDVSVFLKKNMAFSKLDFE